MAAVFPMSAAGYPRAGEREATGVRPGVPGPLIGGPPWGLEDALAACRAAGLPTHAVEVIQVVSTAVLRAGSLVLKVAPPPERGGPHPERQRRLLAACRMWADDGLCVPPADGYEAPLATAHGTVTVWPFTPGTPPSRADWPQIGRLLARLHDAPPPLLEVWRPLERVPAQLAAWQAAGGGCPDIAAAVAAHVQRLQASAGALQVDALVAVHGDVSPANVLVTAAGVRLIDFDRACLGPRQLDVVVAARHAAAVGERDALVDAYGHDPDAWPHRPLVDAIHALGAFTFRLGLAGLQPLDPGWVRAELAGLAEPAGTEEELLA